MPTRKRKHEVRELLQPSMLLKGFERFDDTRLAEISPAYYLEQMFEECGDLETFIEKLKLMLKNAKKAGFERVDLDASYHDDCYGGGDIDIELHGWRPESNDERLQRLRTARKRREAAKKAAAKRKKRRAEKEREDYERLKKKFEGK